MRYLSIFKFVMHYIVSLTGKVTAYILTPFIFGFRHQIRNYTYNFIRQHNIKLKRDVGCPINYTRTHRIIGYPVLFLWFYLDDDASIDISSRSYADFDKIKGIKIQDRFFNIGKEQYKNPNWIHFKSWYNFKSFYYWTVIRNGFYNYNYLVEDSYLDDCDIIDLPIHPRIHESNKNITNWNIKEFYKDGNGKWFFHVSKSKLDKNGFASGYEFGFRRIQPGIEPNTSTGVNAVIRIYKDLKWDVNGRKIKK